MTSSQVEFAVKRCYSTWSENYYRDYYGTKAAYPPVHRDLLKAILRDSGARTVLDAGCGPASFLRELAGEGYDLYGFDLTPEMVAEGQRVFVSLGLPADHLWEGSVLSRESFRPLANANGSFGYDAAVCVGVLPHVPQASDDIVFRNLYEAVVPGGLVIAEARNQLFSLFTFNRYSYDFIIQELIRKDKILANANGSHLCLESTLEELQQRFRMELPPVRRGGKDEPGYDEILSRTHNPLVVREQFAAAGFRDVQILFYHYHCLPPMFESALPEYFRQQSLAMEDPLDWRGHFMASAFLVTGRRE